ncbi:Piso0_005306 [Millerozyma farinosa CBS 7064]|uniref:Piso0_005306 protein n=1 Tax=Pichia sorbitophila (strain ATCC MYA-4447 / BCRC 22081 / CBS 7064 / NBRC 10061 / NRRL Y-12695) TaxID=559304 RepID=G8Y4R7_PICSO|nr:Piso0_005306 [Millerozyma farinosa CBS 7064]
MLSFVCFSMPFFFSLVVHILGVISFATASKGIKCFHLELTHALTYPGGVPKSTFLINGTSPGPLIEADEGDWINVTVVNKLSVATSIHFHGIMQRGTPFSDGVPGVTQLPVNSGEAYSYVFQVKGQYGFSWYHAHYRGYSSDGLYGPVYIRPKKERKRPYSLITNDSTVLQTLYKLEKSPATLISNDHFKYTMDELMARMENYGIEPMCLQSVLINGYGRIYCHDASTFQELRRKKPPMIIDSMGCFRAHDNKGYDHLSIDHDALETPGYSKPCQKTFSQNYIHYTNGSEWQYINVLNAGGQFTKAFSIDAHELIVIAIDGIFVDPVRVHQLMIPVGSRVTILVETKHDRLKSGQDVFAIRFAVALNPQYIEGVGYLKYGTEFSNATQEYQNEEALQRTSCMRFQELDGTLRNPSFKSLWPHETKPLEKSCKLKYKNANRTFSFFLNRTGPVHFSMFENGTRLSSHFENFEPLLSRLGSDKVDHLNDVNGLIRSINHREVVDLIINNSKSYSHPVHLHGHLFHLVSFSPTENFPFSSMQEAVDANYPNVNLTTPPYFDVAFVPPGGHAVLRFVADNPGVWLLHCHNLGHLIGGMGAILLESPDLIRILTSNRPLGAKSTSLLHRSVSKST